jgi:hypothetical protein
MGIAMTGYRTAEDLVAYAADLDKNDPDVPLTLAEAQVHATLALAAATGLNDADGGMSVTTYRAWRAVAEGPDPG